MRLKIFLTFCVVFIGLLNSLGQNRTDSIVSRMLDKARLYIERDIDSSLIIAIQAGDKAKSARFVRGINEANKLIGQIFAIKEKLPSDQERLILSTRVTELLDADISLPKVLLQLGDDYANFSLKENAIRYYQYSIDYAQHQNKLYIAVLALNKQAILLADLGMSQKSLANFVKSINYATSLNDSLLLSNSYSSRGLVQFNLKDYSSSLSSYLQALQSYSATDNTGKTDIYLGIAQNHVYMKHKDEALAYLLQAKTIIDRVGNIASRTQWTLLYSQYQELSDPALALVSYKKYMVLRDSLYMRDKFSYLENARATLNSQKKEFEIDVIREQVNDERIKRRTFLIVSVFLTLLVILFFYHIRKRNKILALENENAKERIRINQERFRNLEEKSLIDQEKEENARQRELLEKERLKQELINAEIERRQLALELDEKHRSLLTNSMQREQYGDFLNELTTSLNQLKESVDIEQLRKGMEKILSFIKGHEIQADDWENMKISFEKVHPGFFEKLKKDFPNLSVNELKFCAYTKMNLNGKEISRLLNINPSSVQVSRYRLKRKMGLAEDVNFTDYILQNY